MRLLSWNVNHHDVWSQLGANDMDLALLQEAPAPPVTDAGAGTQGPAEIVPGSGVPWATTGWASPWRTAIARLSSEISLEPIAIGDMSAASGTLRVSRPGTLTAATVVVGGKPLFTAVSAYAMWERPIAGERPIWADASAHRLLSDLTPLISAHGLPVVVAGDWNILRGYGEHGDVYFGARYQTVFDRAKALGLSFVGPEYPNGRRADPWPDEVPKGSTCVPTYHHSRQTPATATRQLDFVFASESFADRVHATALNDPSEWGPSDHCRVLIEIEA